jgi:RNA 3'-phosphate cyclase
LARLSQAEVSNAQIGSTYLEFSPKNNCTGKFHFDTKTAASASLILQSILPVMAFSRGKTCIELQGGTNVPWAPSIDYVQRVLLPILSNMGFIGSIEVIRRGFYPKGGGIVIARTEPLRHLRPLILVEVEKIQEISGLFYSSRLPCHIVERIALSVNRTLSLVSDYQVKTQSECLQQKDKQCAINAGCGAILTAEYSTNVFFGRDTLGKLGKSAEKVGQELAEDFWSGLASKTPVDKYLGDQLIVYMALAEGWSQIKVEELTSHTLSCIHVSTVITGARFEIEGKKGSIATIKCKGVGIENPFL